MKTQRTMAREFEEKFIGKGEAPETREEAYKLARHMSADGDDDDLAEANELAEAWCDVNGIEDDETDENGSLMDYQAGTYIRSATPDERRDSIEAAKRDGGAGVISVNGRSCYVEG